MYIWKLGVKEIEECETNKYVAVTKKSNSSFACQLLNQMKTNKNISKTRSELKNTNKTWDVMNPVTSFLSYFQKQLR